MKYTYQTFFHENGNLKKEQFDDENGNVSRDPRAGPAFLEYYENGTVKKKVFLVENKLTNPHGPACIEYDEQGVVTNKGYALDGVEMSELDWLEKTGQVSGVGNVKVGPRQRMLDARSERAKEREASLRKDDEQNKTEEWKLPTIHF